MADDRGDVFESDLDLDQLVVALVGGGDQLVETPNKRQHDDNDGASGTSDPSPTKRSRATNDAMTTPAPTMVSPQVGTSTNPSFDPFLSQGGFMTAPPPSSFFSGTTSTPDYAGFDFDTDFAALGPASLPSLTHQPPMPAFDPFNYPTLPTAPTYGTPARFTASTTAPAFPGPFSQYPAFPTPPATGLSPAGHGASPTSDHMGPDAVKRAKKNKARFSYDQLKTLVELDAVQWKHFQAIANEFIKSSDHPERLDAVAKSNKAELQKAAKQQMSEIVEEFLNQNNNGLRYFGRGVDSNGGVPRTWYWPEDKAAAKEAVGCVFSRYIKDVRSAQAHQARHAVDNALTPAATDPSAAPSPAAATVYSTHIHFVGMKDGVYQKALPRMDDRVKDAESYAGLLAEVDQALKGPTTIALWDGAKDADVYKAKMWLHGPKGLVKINSAVDWERVLAAVKEAWWMDNELKLVVYFEEK